MKKRVLFFACLCMLFSLTSRAQEFAYKFKSSDPQVGTIGPVGNITMDYASNAAVGLDNPYYRIGLSSSADRLVKISSSTSNIKKISINYRGTGVNSASGIRIKYYSNSSATTEVGSAIDDIAANSNISTPGKLVEFTVPDGVTYIEIRNDAVNTARIYYVAAGFSAYTLPSPSPAHLTVLPLDLLSFSAKPDALGKSVNLNWKTANEVNTQDFLVERRTDDTEFTTVGTVLSKNVAGTHSYSFTDTKPVAGNSYYRLKQRDKDGKSSYSDIANVKIEGISLSLHPNPVSKDLVVSHDYVKQSASLKVIGLDGKTHIKTNSAVGSSSTIINVASLASGTYLLVQDVNGKSQSQKFIKK